MKHTLKITIILLILFLATQLIGLTLVNKSFIKPLPYQLERPEFKTGLSFTIQLLFILFIATIIILLFAKFRFEKLWKVSFFFSVWFALTIAFSVFLNQILATIIAFILAGLKTFYRDVISHNFTELFIYAGLAVMFVPIKVLSIFWISMLLIFISIYDMIAVWKTKHMIKLAKFQAKSRVFAGLLIPYDKGKNTAVLGGGDIGFPLLFAGVALKTLSYKAFLIPVFASFALVYLLIFGEKKKFYPAMPYLTIGCFIGYLIAFLI